MLPPIKRGDVERLVTAPSEQGQPGVIAVVDGYFHLENLAVGHAELRGALAAGWQVWGLSSMGAIRACELHALGMKGYGQVFARYCEDPDFRDDEVGFLHEPTPPYREVSEPLVHLRAALAALEAEGHITPADTQHILNALMPMWFGDRTLALFRQLVTARVPGAEPAVRHAVASIDRYRVKAHDLVRFLEERPWERA